VIILILIGKISTFKLLLISKAKTAETASSQLEIFQIKLHRGIRYRSLQGKRSKKIKIFNHQTIKWKQ
jgi:hypothetical protein